LKKSASLSANHLCRQKYQKNKIEIKRIKETFGIRLCPISILVIAEKQQPDFIGEKD